MTVTGSGFPKQSRLVLHETGSSPHPAGAQSLGQDPEVKLSTFCLGAGKRPGGSAVRQRNGQAPPTLCLPPQQQAALGLGSGFPLGPKRAGEGGRGRWGGEMLGAGTRPSQLS